MSRLHNTEHQRLVKLTMLCDTALKDLKAKQAKVCSTIFSLFDSGISKIYYDFHWASLGLFCAKNGNFVTMYFDQAEQSWGVDKTQWAEMEPVQIFLTQPNQ